MYRDNDEIEIDLLELFYALKKKAVIIILCSLIGAGIFAAYSFLIAKPVYESTAKIYILSQSTSLTSFADIQISSSLAKDYEEMIFSRSVVLTVNKNLGLDYDYEALKNKLTVTNPADTRVLNISCRSNDKQEACNLANEFATVSKRQIADFMDTDEPTIFEKAVVSSKPVKPEKAKNIAIGFLLGFLLACAVVIVRYMLNDSIKSEEDIERYLGLNVLAAIPNEKTQKVQGLKFSESGEANRQRGGR
jgi:capsular polysaccharide biosynthesis protein